MNERDFQIGARKFKLNKINTFEQFHIVRRLLPILGELLPVLGKVQKLGKLDPEKMSEEQLQMFVPVIGGLSKLSDEDANRVLLGLCSAVEMQQQPANNWARVATSAGLMFEDLELPVIMQIAGRAFAYNMSGFFALMPQVSAGVA